VHNLNKEKAKSKESLQDEPEQLIRAKLAEETKRVLLYERNPDKQVIVSSLLDSEAENNLISFLHENNDIFA
jgi:hypothetical protein